MDHPFADQCLSGVQGEGDLGKQPISIRKLGGKSFTGRRFFLIFFHMKQFVLHRAFSGFMKA